MVHKFAMTVKRDLCRQPRMPQASALAGFSGPDAIGGDLAYQYGRAGTLAGIGANAAQGVIGDTAFGRSPQILNAATSWQGETLKLG